MKRLSILAGALLALTMAGATLANPLHQSTPIVGTQFGNQDCSDGLGQGWVFVNTGSHDANGAILSAIFAGAGLVTVDGFTPGNGVVHYFVGVSASDTLLAADDNLDTDGLLNLSHVCSGDQSSPTPSASATPTPSDSATPTPSSSATPTPSASATPSESPSITPSQSPSATPVVTKPPLPPTDTQSPTSDNLVAFLGIAILFLAVALIAVTKRLRE